MKPKKMKPVKAWAGRQVFGGPRVYRLPVMGASGAIRVVNGKKIFEPCYVHILKEQP